MDEAQKTRLARMHKYIQPVDRSTWPRGPWSDEPDHEIGFTPDGLVYILNRNSLGVWCGYVVIPPTLPEVTPDDCECVINHMHGRSWAFDCGHLYQYGPGLTYDLRDPSDHYVKISEARQKCAKLSAQAVALWRGEEVPRG